MKEEDIFMSRVSKALVSGDRFVSASVPVYFFKYNGDKCIYAECPSLRITTYAQTLGGAKKMFKEAFALWLEVATEDGIKEELRNLGWKITETSIIPKNEDRRVPLEILASKTVNLKIPIRNIR